MTTLSPHLNVELFEIEKKQLLEACSSISSLSYEPYFTPKAMSLFATEWEGLWHLASILRLENTEAILHTQGNTVRLVTFSSPKSETYSPFFIDDPEYKITLHQLEDSPACYSDFNLVRAAVIKAIRSKISENIRFEGNIGYDPSTDLTREISGKSKNELLKPITAHIGFSFMFRAFSDKFYVQILPHSHVVYNLTIADLLNQGYDEKFLIENFPYITIPSQGNMRLLRITNKTVSDPLYEERFNGRSFEEFATKMYPNWAILPQTPLLEVVSSRATYFPADWCLPSLNFIAIQNLSEQFYSELIGILKMQSKKRPQAAIHWAQQLSPLKIGDKTVELKPIPLAVNYDSKRLSPSEFSVRQEINTQGFVFKAPSITMLRNGDQTEILPGVAGYQATVNDLLTHQELKPLDVPNQIEVVAFVHSQLVNGWNALRKSLLEGVGSYRGFQNTFGTELKFEKEVIMDFGIQELETKIGELPECGYKCALIIVPRYMKTPEETKQVYTVLKTAIMERGIPVQAIADDQKTFNRDNSLVGKSQNPRTMFGLAINIMAKTGTILCALSEGIATRLIPDSMILGYNVGRVIPADTTGMKTVPLSAPLVIFDNRGAYVSHQNVYQLKSEISLFEQYGGQIFGKLPHDIMTLIVHKDGYFGKFELDTLKKRATEFNVKVIAVSIRKNEIPRVFNPQYFGPDIGLEAGTVLPLSNSDFLMITTPTGRWDPEKLGWPNPILVTFHDVEDTQLVLKALYQIYALTKMQTASQRAIRVPISIHFSNMITHFLRKVGDPTPTFLQYFVEKGQKGKSLPRWFL